MYSSGFTCTNNLGPGANLQTCLRVAGNGATVPVYTCSATATNGLQALTLPTVARSTTTASNGTNVYSYHYDEFSIYAPMIEIRWRSADRNGIPSETGKAVPTSSTSSPTTSSSSSSGSTLSTGAKAAIGVAVPVVVLALLAVSCLFWRRRKRKSKVYAWSDTTAVSEKRQPETAQLDSGHVVPLAELDAGGKRTELSGDTPHRQELEGSKSRGSARRAHY